MAYYNIEICVGKKHRQIPAAWRYVSWLACLLRADVLRKHQNANSGPTPSPPSSESHDTNGVDHEWWAFAWLHYASLCPVVDGYRALVRSNRSKYEDPQVDQLLKSHLVPQLFGFRDTVFHYTSLQDI